MPKLSASRACAYRSMQGLIAFDCNGRRRNYCALSKLSRTHFNLLSKRKIKCRDENAFTHLNL